MQFAEFNEVSSVQFQMVPTRSAKPIIYALHPGSPKFLQRCLWNGSNVRLIDDGPLSSFQGRSSSSSSFHASLLQEIDDVMSFALCPQVVSQASQHLRSSEKQATFEGCFACQSICSVISLQSGMSRAVHPQEFSKVHVDHRHIQWRQGRQSHIFSLSLAEKEMIFIHRGGIEPITD